MMSEPKKSVRVRMAPSPTGYLHIGGARTTLFNWLFARHSGGTFVLRIEDTDKARSKKEFEEDILNELAWLGLGGDEGVVEDGKQIGEFGPYRQSERTAIYRQHMEKLLAEHKAYYCFCTPEELEEARVASLSSGQPPRYSGRCRSLGEDLVHGRLAQGEKAVIRFKVGSGEIKLKDLIRGEITFDGNLVGDFVIGKSLDEPLYNFTVVIDDALMEITHVIRGEEHTNNTPRQILILEALGFSRPSYAHIPLILNADRSKMSKRSGDTSVHDYRKAGYLPGALINFLAFLGWHPEGNDEVVSIERMISEFDLSKVQKGGAVFNIEKLDWLNNQYIRAKNATELYGMLTPDFIDAEWTRQGEAKILAVIDLLKERLSKLSDFSEQARMFFETLPYDPKMLIWSRGRSSASRLGETEKAELHSRVGQSASLKAEEALTKCAEAFNKSDDMVAIEKEITALADEIGRGEVYWPLRVALSGLEKSPPPMEIAKILGVEESEIRIKTALDKISALTHPDSFSG